VGVDWSGNDSVDVYWPQVMSVQGYYPFGMAQPGRNYNPTEYKFGFQGYLKDDEIYGANNSYTTEFRQYDPRIDRWWSRDPVRTAWESPYAAYRNNPIYYVDPTGACPECKENVDDPEVGQTYESEGGATYEYMETEEGNVWIKQGGELSEVTVTAEKDESMPAQDLSADIDNTRIDLPQRDFQLSIGEIARQTQAMVREMERRQNTGQSESDFELRDLTTDPLFQTSLEIGSLADPPAPSGISYPIPNWLKVTGKWTGRFGAGVTVFNKVTKDEDLKSKDYMDLVHAGMGLIPTGITQVAAANYFVITTFGEPNPNASSDPEPEPLENAALCLVEGTEVLMGDLSYKEIEKIKVGDTVKTIDLLSDTLKNTKVLEIASPIHKRLVTIQFSNEDSLTATLDHPIYVQGKGWSSFAPELTERRYNVESNKVEVGDTCRVYATNDNPEKVTIQEITPHQKSVKTYTLSKLSGGSDNFIAGGIIVHFEGYMIHQSKANQKE
jgi:RHS repeat-associated protein